MFLWKDVKTVKLLIKIKHCQVNNNNNIKKFHQISIKGRFIYGYLCLRNTIDEMKAQNLPYQLDEILCEFVSSNRLDLWQDRADKVLPSIILDESNDEKYFESITHEIVLILRKYYQSQPPILNELIEELIDLGLANLYCGFDTDISFPYIEQIIKLMIEHNIELPDFQIVETCSVKERHGWGEYANMIDFLNHRNSML